MGGAANLPQRSSSPLKRRASDLEAEVQSDQQDDVDMIAVPTTDLTDVQDGSAQSSRTRTHSVDLLKNGSRTTAAAGLNQAQTESAAVYSNSVETGMAGTC